MHTDHNKRKFLDVLKNLNLSAFFLLVEHINFTKKIILFIKYGLYTIYSRYSGFLPESEQQHLYSSKYYVLGLLSVVSRGATSNYIHP